MEYFLHFTTAMYCSTSLFGYNFRFKIVVKIFTPHSVNASYWPQLSIYPSVFQRWGVTFKTCLTLQSVLRKLQEPQSLLLSFSFFFLNCNISLFNLTSSDDQNVMLKGLNNSSDDFVLLEEKYARDKLSSLAIVLERLRNEWSY